MKQHYLILLTVLMGMAACVDDNDPERWRKGIVLEEFIYKSNDVDFPSCHAASIEETPEGLITAWFGGLYERHPEVSIYVSRKVDDHWTQPQMAADGVINDSLRYACWNPVLYQVPGGELQLYYKVGPNVSAWLGMMKTSNDHGKTWSQAIQLPEGILGPVKNRPVLLDDGRLICPSSTEGGAWRIHFEETPDFGKTWKKNDPIGGGREYAVIQPAILTHNDSTLQMLSRSKNAVIATSWSYDRGKTWSLVLPSGLPNNNSAVDAVTLQDGRHLAAYNHVATAINSDKGYRTPLNVAVSDDGRNWSAALILEDSEISQYSYPSLIQSSDGMVHIVYTWRRELIKYMKIDPSKLILSPIKNGEWPVPITYGRY